MEKKYGQFVFLVIVIFMFVWFISYKFYFDGFCNSLGETQVQEELNIAKFAKCNDSIVCRVENKTVDVNVVQTWECKKRRIGVFELDYYTNVFKKYF